MPTSTSLPATSKRLLAAAEKLFAEHGPRGVSLRELTRAAGANLASVNYHFGDMAAVYREVLLRRLRPLQVRRLTLLEEAMAGAQLPSLPVLLAALARPLFELQHDEVQGGRAFVRLLCRAVLDDDPVEQRLIAEEYHPPLARFAQQIRRHLTPEEFLWRFSFVLGTLHQTVATLHQMTGLTRGICRSDDPEGTLQRFVAHAASTLSAPLISTGSAGQHPS
jgi:AcrR family transcriptional regulator